MRETNHDQRAASAPVEEISFGATNQPSGGYAAEAVGRFPDAPDFVSTGGMLKASKQSLLETISRLHPCAACSIRCRAAAHPASFFNTIHLWHKKWWPGWKIYQAELRRHALDADGNESMNSGKEQ